MNKNKFDVDKLISFKDIQAMLMPHLTEMLDDQMLVHFSRVYAGHRKLLYEGRDPLTWLQHLNLLDAVAMDFEIAKSIRYSVNYSNAKKNHAFLLPHVLKFCEKFSNIALGVHKAREAMNRKVQKHFQETGEQLP